MLKVSITKKLKGFTLNSSFELTDGITGIIGPSGSGKSVTLHCIAGLQTPDSGEIILDGYRLFHSSNRINIKTRERSIGYVFQNYALFPHLTVQQNVAFGLNGISRQKIKQKVAEMIEKVHLTAFQNAYPHQLSGGQQQRVAIARTLVTDPKMLFLDEPFSALDHHIKHIVEQEFLQIIRDNFSGIVLLITHNIEEAYKLCDRVLLYNNGSVVQYGSKDDVFKKPESTVAAKIIGCKNIIPLTSLQQHNGTVWCDVSGVQVRVAGRWARKASHIGIHAEDVVFTQDTGPTENLFPFRLAEIIEGIHHTSVTVRVSDAFTVCAIMQHNSLETLLSGQCKIKLPPEKLFILE